MEIALYPEIMGWFAPFQQHHPCVRVAQALAGSGSGGRTGWRLPREHWETVTLVDHATGAPVASRGYGEEGGEPRALQALLADLDLRSRTVTCNSFGNCIARRG